MRKVSYQVTKIDAGSKLPMVSDPSGSVISIKYDKPVMGMGEQPSKPSAEIDGCSRVAILGQYGLEIDLTPLQPVVLAGIVKLVEVSSSAVISLSRRIIFTLSSRIGSLMADSPHIEQWRQ